MSNYTFLLLFLVLLIGTENGSSVQQDWNTEMPTKSGQSKIDKDVSEFESPEFTSKKADYVSHSSKNNNPMKTEKKKKDVSKTEGFMFENYDELPRYERIRIRMYYELRRAFRRIYNRFFNYPQYEADKENDPQELQFFDNAILGAIVSCFLFIIQLIIHIFQIWYYKYS